MPERRKPRSQITPSYEDKGLFKNPVGWTQVELIPSVWHNRRGDVVIAAHVADAVPVEVLFAGRRAARAAPLARTLSKMRKDAAEAGWSEDQLATLRLPLKVKGAWRPRFQSDRQGWQSRVYQLIVADWRLGQRTS